MPSLSGHIRDNGLVEPKCNIGEGQPPEPDKETSNRKPLRRQVAFEAEWELRFKPDNRFRVFYDIDITSHKVHILAIGDKERNRLIIGGKEVKL